MENIPFPDLLDVATLERFPYVIIPTYNIKYARLTEERKGIKDIKFKSDDSFSFTINGRKSGLCFLTVAERAGMESGALAITDIALHYAVERKLICQIPRQGDLFESL